jgi:hypothetical protein
MSNKLRITGDNPSPGLLEQYPNWENALDEEDVDGQDETTLRPAEDQSVIVEYGFTAGIVWLNDGRECAAIIEMLDDVSAIQFYLDGKWYRIVRWSRRSGEFERWESYVEHWLPQDQRTCPPLSLDDETFFPLRFASRLPFHKTSSPIKVRILPSGSEEAWS